jgi:hypothetical protein
MQPLHRLTQADSTYSNVIINKVGFADETTRETIGNLTIRRGTSELVIRTGLEVEQMIYILNQIKHTACDYLVIRGPFFCDLEKFSSAVAACDVNSFTAQTLVFVVYQIDDSLPHGFEDTKELKRAFKDSLKDFFIYYPWTDVWDMGEHHKKNTELSQCLSKSYHLVRMKDRTDLYSVKD